MICTRCNNEIPNECIFCNICGKKTRKNKKIRVSKSSSQNKKTYLYTIVAIMSIAVASFFLIKHLSPVVSYNNAKQLYVKKEYKEAIEIFSELNDYKDSKAMIVECQYQTALVHIQKKEYSNAIEALKKLNDYKNTSKLLIDAQYQFGLECYNKGLITKAKSILSKFAYYGDTKVVLEKIACYELLLGTWSNENFIDLPDKNKVYDDLVFNEGWEMVDILNSGTKDKHVYNFQFNLVKINESSWKVIIGNSMKYKFDFEMRSLYETDDENYNFRSFSIDEIGKEMLGWFKKKDGFITIPVEPAIGMTKSDVKKSTWGIPDKVNTSTTIYGTTEQWVYKNRGYIYFDGEIVSSIQTN